MDYSFKQYMKFHISIDILSIIDAKISHFKINNNKKKINFLDAIINNLIKTYSINTILVVDGKSDKLKFVFEDISISLSKLHLKKAFLPIIFREQGFSNFASDNDEQPSKACCSIEVTKEGIIILVNEEQL